MRTKNFHVITKAVVSTALLTALSANASPVTYTFVGVMHPGYGFDGQSVEGFLTVDPERYNRTFTDSPTYLQSYLDNSPNPQPTGVSGRLSLSGGFVVEVGGLMTAAETYVIKNSPDRGSGFIVDAGSSINNNSTFFQLVTNRSDSPQAVFPDRALDDFYPDQAVVFNTPGSLNIGYFYFNGAADPLPTTGRFDITNVSVTGFVPAPVPEPGTLVLMLGGLLACVGMVRRRGDTSE